MTHNGAAKLLIWLPAVVLTVAGIAGYVNLQADVGDKAEETDVKLLEQRTNRNEADIAQLRKDTKDSLQKLADDYNKLGRNVSAIAGALGVATED